MYTKETSSIAARVHSNSHRPEQHLLSQLPSAVTHTEPDTDIVWVSSSACIIREGEFSLTYSNQLSKNPYVSYLPSKINYGGTTAVGRIILSLEDKSLMLFVSVRSCEDSTAFCKRLSWPSE